MVAVGYVKSPGVLRLRVFTNLELPRRFLSLSEYLKILSE